MMRTIKKFIKRKKLRSIRYAFNLLWYESFYYNCLGIYAYRFFPHLFQQIRPRLFELEVTTYCNLRCTMCEHTHWHEPNRHLSLDQFKRITKEFGNFIWCGLTGIGSSLLNQDFIPMLRYVKEELSPDIFVELYDNFYLLDAEKAKEFIRLGIDFLLISVDGASPEVYNKIRVGSDFEVVMQNVETMIQLKKKTSSFFPELGFHYIISKQNLHEVPDFVRYVHSRFENDTYKYIYYTAILHPFEEIKDIATHVPEDIIEETNHLAGKYRIKLIWNHNIPDKKPKIENCRAWIEPFIFVDGTVIPCCAGNERNNREFQRKHSLGNIQEQSLNEIWFGNKYHLFRKKLLRGEVPVQCRNCPVKNVSRAQEEAEDVKWAFDLPRIQDYIT